MKPSRAMRKGLLARVYQDLGTTRCRSWAVCCNVFVVRVSIYRSIEDRRLCPDYPGAESTGITNRPASHSERHWPSLHCGWMSYEILRSVSLDQKYIINNEVLHYLHQLMGGRPKLCDGLLRRFLDCKVSSAFSLESC